MSMNTTLSALTLSMLAALPVAAQDFSSRRACAESVQAACAGQVSGQRACTQAGILACDEYFNSGAADPVYIRILVSQGIGGLSSYRAIIEPVGRQAPSANIISEGEDGASPSPAPRR